MNNADTLAMFALAVTYSEWLGYEINERGELMDKKGAPKKKRNERDFSWLPIIDGILGKAIEPRCVECVEDEKVVKMEEVKIEVITSGAKKRAGLADLMGTGLAFVAAGGVVEF